MYNKIILIGRLTADPDYLIRRMANLMLVLLSRLIAGIRQKVAKKKQILFTLFSGAS